MVSPLGYHPRAWYGSRGAGVSQMRRAEGNTESLPPNLGELSEQDVMNVFEIVRQEFNIDTDRMYLWGHSMGGAGTYHLAAKHPDLWAALGVAAPAPSASIDQLEAFKHVPIIVLQGDEDQLVTTTREWVAKMKSSVWSTSMSRSKAGTTPDLSTRARKRLRSSSRSSTSFGKTSARQRARRHA